MLSNTNRFRGKLVIIGLTVMFITTVAPFTTFGMIYKEFLAKFGNATSYITIIHGVFNSISLFMGIITNQLIKKYPKRYIGIIGSLFFSFGSLLNVFARNIFEIIISFSILQGIGFGLMMPISFMIFNDYFKNDSFLMMSISQVIIAFTCILFPYIIEFCLHNFGYRGTLLLVAGFSFNGIVAMTLMKPKQKRNVIQERYKNADLKIDLNAIHILSQTTENATNTIKSIEFHLITNPIFINIIFGMSVSLTTDLMFLSLMPLLFNRKFFDDHTIALLMTIFLTFDLLSRIFLFIISFKLKRIQSRYVLLIGMVCTTFARLIFIFVNNFWIIVCIISLLGYLRCFIHISIPLVLAEQFTRDEYPVGFCIYMVLCGVITIFLGLTASIISFKTDTDIFVILLLSLPLAISSISWIIELTYKFLKT